VEAHFHHDFLSSLTGITGKKEEKALWKKGSTYLTTKLIPVIPVIPVVPASSAFNSGLGFADI
jgi:hypothetical protein